jgi:dTDP-4-dehydrorhamnose 3,5-epimerase
MHSYPLVIPDVICFTPKVFEDHRGFFYESFNEKAFEQSIKHPAPNFVQDNHSRSIRGVLRGLHYQIQKPQGKLVRVVHGEVFDVAVDIRKSSTTFGKWVGEILSAQNRKQLWIPPGFAHGFFVISKTAEFLYKTTDFFAPQFERCIAWNDTTVGIDWKLQGINPLLSSKDIQGKPLIDAECFE